MMLKCIFSAITTVWMLFTILLIYTPEISSICIHDQIGFPNISVDHGRSRWKRDDEQQYEPLQIFTYMDEMDPSVTINAIDNIKNALGRVKTALRQSLKVERMSKKFLLQRLSCDRRWQEGRNKGKCAKIKPVGEYCSVKDSKFEIPDRFLDSLEAYNQHDKWPYETRKAGKGVEGFNFILFVMGRSRSWCTQPGVQAYSSYCRIDKLGRPIAGLLNICPEYFSKEVYSAEHYFNVILHELIHTLGFSASLFEKYKGCSLSSSCNKTKNIYQKDAANVARLQFPPVLKKTQVHFFCQKPDYGGPVALQKDELTSHWHPLLMYSSIMTPSFTEGETMILDRITLALLESTGWYEVNYFASQPFLFGKGKGCDFGNEGSCEKDIYPELCTKDSNSTSCDPLHFGLGFCENVDPDAPCGVYKPKKMYNCKDIHDSRYGSEFRVLEYQEMCFMTETASNKPQPECLFVKCKSKRTYEVLSNNTWLNCRRTAKASADGVTVYCVPELPICMQREDYNETITCKKGINYVISIRMYFNKPTFKDLLISSTYKNFKVSTLSALAKTIGIPVNYIVNATLSVFKQLFLDFSICPPETLNNEELGNVVWQVQQFLQVGVFANILKGYEDIVISSTDIQIDPEDATAFSDHEGILALSAIPVICGIFLISTFVASLIRMLVIHKHRPRRSEEATAAKTSNEMSHSSPEQSSGRSGM